MEQAARRGGRRIIGGLLAAAALLPAVPAQAQDGSYEFGRGLRLGDSGFTLGGYATLQYVNAQGDREQLKSGHASAFVWWEGLDRAKVFAEIDVVNAVARDRHDAAYDDTRRVSLERLYADYAFSDAFTLRGGKFLTPIGRWNLIHAEPLVWTTSGPLITQQVFPRNVTGASASGQLHGVLMGASLGYVVFASNGSEWRADRWQDPFSRVRGLRLTTSLPGEVQLGLSVANYELDSWRGDSRRLRGLDLSWQHNRWELSAEWLRTNPSQGGYRPAPTDSPGPWPQTHPYGARPVDGGGPLVPGKPGARRTQGGFVQGVAPLAGAWFLVLRGEWLDSPQSAATQRRTLAGLTWRPNAGVALKFEWLQDEGRLQGSTRSLASSLSVLF